VLRGLPPVPSIQYSTPIPRDPEFEDPEPDPDRRIQRIYIAHTFGWSSRLSYPMNC
jgi:hypothetical protein